MPLRGSRGAGQNAVNFFLPSPPLRGRGVGGEGGAFAATSPLTPGPSPEYRERGESWKGNRCPF